MYIVTSDSEIKFYFITNRKFNYNHKILSKYNETTKLRH